MAWDIASNLRNRDLRNRKSSAATPSSQLFYQSRLRLARWYAGVMGGILALLGVGVYYAIAHAHSVTADRELQSVSDTVHDAILAEAARPGVLAPFLSSVLPDSGIYPSGYYIRIIDLDGQLLATAGEHPKGLPLTAPVPEWQSIKDTQGQVYHQRSRAITLPTNNHNTAGPRQAWAYLVVGSPFREFHTYLATVRWMLLIGVLLAVALIAAASWWLAALAMRPIYQSYQQVQQFTADAAHELRTPLAAVQATVESVLRLPHLSEQEAQETLKVVGRQNKRLTALVSDLLLLSRFDGGRFNSPQQHSAKQLCCFPDVLNDITEEIAAIALSKKIALSVDIQTSPTLSILANEEQLYRLVLNLVNNALTYTPKGGKVTLTLKQQQNDVLLLVSDTGIGIAPEHQGKIFDRFYQVDDARAKQSGNSGLGLAIAKAIAFAHSGTLTVSSQLEKGSTFIASFPMPSSPLQSS